MAFAKAIHEQQWLNNFGASIDVWHVHQPFSARGFAHFFAGHPRRHACNHGLHAHRLGFRVGIAQFRKQPCTWTSAAFARVAVGARVRRVAPQRAHRPPRHDMIFGQTLMPCAAVLAVPRSHVSNHKPVRMQYTRTPHGNCETLFLFLGSHPDKHVCNGLHA